MAELDLEEGGKVHSRIGPSSASRWMNCAGSVALVEKLGDKARKSGIAAAEGSAAHDLLARCLTSGDEAWEHNGEKIKSDSWTFDVTPEMTEAVQIALDWTRSKVAQLSEKGKEAILLVERRVASPEDADAFGTSDIIIIVPGERVIVADFKYGIGVTVEPDDEQLRSYGQYTFDTYKTFGDLDPSQYNPEINPPTTEIFPDQNTVAQLFIVQPRIPHPKGLVRQHVTDRKELARWFYGEVLPAIAETRNPEATLNAGEHCRFCPASDFCPLLHKARETFDTTTLPVTLDDAALDAALTIGKQIVKQMERLEEEAFNRASKGTKFEHWKLVRKIASRVWKDGAEAAVKEALGAAAYSEPKLLTPPAVEKLEGGKKLVAQWSMKPETGVTLAARSDKREEFVSTQNSFDEANGVAEEEVVY